MPEIPRFVLDDELILQWLRSLPLGRHTLLEFGQAIMTKAFEELQRRAAAMSTMESGAHLYWARRDGDGAFTGEILSADIFDRGQHAGGAWIPLLYVSGQGGPDQHARGAVTALAPAADEDALRAFVAGFGFGLYARSQTDGTVQ